MPGYKAERANEEISRSFSSEESLTMFHSSTQRKHWTFANEIELTGIRAEVNNAYCQRFRENPSTKKDVNFLTVEEERGLIEYYQLVLIEVCD